MKPSELNMIIDAVPSITARLGRSAERGGFGMGVRASLRRMNPDTPEGAMGAVCTVLAGAEIPLEGLDAGSLERVALAMHILALLGGGGINPHDPKVPTGRSMAEGGLSEARFVRLLTARGPVCRDQIVRVARYLGGKGQRLDCRPLAELVLVEGRDELRAEKIRLRLAQFFYSARFRE